MAGVPLLGLDGWSPAIPPFLNPAAAIVTKASSSNGRQSVEVRGSNLISFGGITAIGMFQTPDVSGILLRTAMVTYALPDDVGRTRVSYTARFDNFRISVHGSTSP